MTKEEAIKHIKAMCQMLLGADNKPISDTYYALEMALEKLSAEQCVDAISRQSSIDELKKHFSDDGMKDTECGAYWHHVHVIDVLQGMPSVTPKQRTGWIPVSERLPEDLEAVNITWVNHEPEPYYHNIKDKNFVATGIHYKGQWYWYSTTCADYLGEYGSNDIDKVDDAVEIVAWMPLPTPYEPQESEGKE